jgi:magnesium transporter
MPFKAYYLTPEGQLQRDLTESDITKAFNSRQGLLWVDFPEMTEDDGKFMEQNFRFHRLSIEDCVSTQIHPPKIDAFTDFLFIIVHGINHVAETEIVETAELVLYLGKSFVITSHSFPLYSISDVQHTLEDNTGPMKQGADFLAYTIIDTLVDNVMPTIDRMNDVADEIEEAVIQHPQPDVLEGILKLKRSSLKVHRIMSPQREVLNRLSRGEFSIIKPEAQIYFRDIYDHLVRIEDLNQTILDRNDNAVSTYLSSVANRQNETMKILSVVATIFMPLTLLVGIYGMNFKYMPETEWHWGYFTIWGIIGAVILILLWRFWASGWFERGKKRMAWIKPFIVEGKKLRGYFAPGSKRRVPPPSDTNTPPRSSKVG